MSESLMETFTTRAIELYDQLRGLVGPIRVGWDEYARSIKEYDVLGQPGKTITPEDVSKFLSSHKLITRVGTIKDRESRIEKAKSKTEKWSIENKSDDHKDTWSSNGYTLKEIELFFLEDEKRYYDLLAYDHSQNDEHFIIIIGRFS
jgi:hypothetical protein